MRPWLHRVRGFEVILGSQLSFVAMHSFVLYLWKLSESLSAVGFVAVEFSVWGLSLEPVPSGKCSIP